MRYSQNTQSGTRPLEAGEFVLGAGSSEPCGLVRDVPEAARHGIAAIPTVHLVVLGDVAIDVPAAVVADVVRASAVVVGDGADDERRSGCDGDRRLRIRRGGTREREDADAGEKTRCKDALSEDRLEEVEDEHFFSDLVLRRALV